MDFRHVKSGMKFIIWREMKAQSGGSENLIDVLYITKKEEDCLFYRSLYLSSLKKPNFSSKEIEMSSRYWDESFSNVPMLYGSQMKREVAKGVFGDIKVS
jgi:hypothetical protein